MRRGLIVLLIALLVIAVGVAVRNWQERAKTQQQVEELQAKNQSLGDENRNLERRNGVLAKEKQELADAKRELDERIKQLEADVKRAARRVSNEEAKQASVAVIPDVAVEGAWPSVEKISVGGDFRAPRRRDGEAHEIKVEKLPAGESLEVPLRVIVDPSGRIQSVEPIGEPTQLAELAQAEVEGYSYEPARHRGSPSSADVYLRFVFPGSGE